LEHAVRAKDRPGIEQFLDVRRTAESVVDEASSAAGALEAADPSLKPSLIIAMQQSIWTALLDSLATLEGRYQGLAGVEELGGVAAGPHVPPESGRAPGDFRRKWHGLARDRAPRSGHRRMPHRRRDRRAPRRRGTRSEMLDAAPGRDQVVLEALLLILMQQ